VGKGDDVLSEEPSSNDLRVPVAALSVEVRYTDGRTVTGRIFVPSTSEHHAGPVRADDWINDGSSFFPFLPTDSAQSVLVNKDAVLAIVLATRSREPDHSGAATTRARVIAVECDGASFQGVVTIEMAGSHGRVLDHLNRRAAFLELCFGGRDLLINKRHIRRVVEVRED
jgi:hypothetical protein